jgi:hypothetical protein
MKKIVNKCRVCNSLNVEEFQPDVISISTMAYEREIRESFKKMELNAEVLLIGQIIDNAL